MQARLTALGRRQLSRAGPAAGPRVVETPRNAPRVRQPVRRPANEQLSGEDDTTLANDVALGLDLLLDRRHRLFRALIRRARRLRSGSQNVFIQRSEKH